MAVNYMKTVLLSVWSLAIFCAISFAQDGLGAIGCAAGCMCYQLMQVLPVVSMLMIIGAGVVYAAGQMMGAETRARANTWATAMLIGAVIGILIVVVAPNVLGILYPSASAKFSDYGGTNGICTNTPVIGSTTCLPCTTP